ncbi:type IV toxin-antitoxin system AbiEi family antitoxin domain-containing protein [Arthrobacter sp. StoSoilB5]|uniref:type IV toxin-antitoxin system AbiEi family antitoxin domain-containing protein n=1 Tax=Arthrobacter sp. StoSoilB5 TaxID=2830992 RepID=UPI001CC4E10D|nr:type IV toxin-antitoxin system AbiEi family antitoxin domain-containing protein [Arthrobacter sp. StoSoilB5]BCW43682.1 transcriptional regulator [Arthrobacter sp. StoSoilB5]
MKRQSHLVERLPRGLFSISEAAKHGVSHASLYRMRDAGLVERIGSGLYIAGTGIEADIDLLEASRKAPLATICLTSALARHGLIDEIPSSIDLALPRGKTPPQLSAQVTWHIFDKATFDVGRSSIAVEGEDEARIGIYSPERSIVDAFRLRASAGYETGIEALRNWLKRPESQPARLMDIASSVPRSKRPLRQAMEVLL